MVHLIPGFPNKIRQLDTDSQFHIDLRMTYYQLTTNSNQQHIFINKCNFYSGTKFWFYKTVLNCSIGFTNFIVFSFYLVKLFSLSPSISYSLYLYIPRFRIMTNWSQKGPWKIGFCLFREWKKQKILSNIFSLSTGNVPSKSIDF